MVYQPTQSVFSFSSLIHPIHLTPPSHLIHPPTCTGTRGRTGEGGRAS